MTKKINFDFGFDLKLEEIKEKLESNIGKDVGIIPKGDKCTFPAKVIWVSREYNKVCIYIKEWMSGIGQGVKVMLITSIDDVLKLE